MIIKIRKKNLKLYILLIIYIIISGIILFLSNNVFFDIISFVLLVIGAISLVKFDIAHPYVWYSLIFMFYSLSYPILYLYGMTYDVYVYTKSLIFTQWLALVVFLLCVTPAKVNYSKLNKKKKKLLTNRVFLFLVSLIVIVMIVNLINGKFSHKSEIIGSSIVFFLGFRAVLVMLILYTINLTIYSLKKSKLDKKLIFYTFVLIFTVVFFSGERDLIIRFFILTLFIYYIIIKKSKLNINILILGFFSLTLLPFLKKIKYFGLTGKITSGSSNLLITFLKSDFISASKNLQILLLDESSKGFLKGRSFFSAILRTFELDKLSLFEVVSSGQWFNEHYFGADRAGQGFTLVGDGYVNFGYLGIIVLFIFIGLLVKYLYKKSNEGVYYFSFYILSIPIFMYTIRADLANILSPLVQQNLLLMLLIIIFTEFYYKIL